MKLLPSRVRIWFAVGGILFVLLLSTASSSDAQEVIGISAILSSTNASHIDTYSATEMDAVTAYYYDAYVEGYLYQNGSLLASGYAYGNPTAAGGFTQPLILGDTYILQSAHYLVAYYAYYDGVNYYYSNPDYYLNFTGDTGDPSGSGFVSGGGPAYYTTAYIYLGYTQVSLPTGVPSISSINPSSGSISTSGTINVQGSNLEDLFTQTTTSAITGSGMTLTVQSVTPTQVTLSFSIASNASTGAHNITLTTRFGTSNAVAFNVGDPTPVVTSITPNVWPAGSNVSITIAGTGFGTNPSVSMNGSGVSQGSITSANDTQIMMSVSVAPCAANQTVTLQVQSNGYGSGFVATTSGQAQSGSNTATVSPIVAPAPQISLGGTVINGTQTVVVGQQIALTVSVAQPAGACISNQSWSQPQGNAVGGYTNLSGTASPGANGGKLQSLPPLTSTSSAPYSLTFYWADSGNPRPITYSYTLSNGNSNSASVTFNVVGLTGNLLFQPNMLTDGSGVQVLIASGTPALSTTGIPVGTKQVGITFTSNATPPAGYNQSFTWVQLLSAIQNQYVNVNGPFADPASPESGVDNTYPYANASPTTTNDTPKAGLPSIYGEGWETFTATMYLMWDPALPSGCTPASTDPHTLVSTPSTCTSIPVPLSSVTWHWSGCAINTLVNQTNGTTWILNTSNGCPVQTLGNPQTAVFPEWTHQVVRSF